MINVPGKLIRISAFLRKEIFEVIRQPLLVLTLILGPFLIMFFFGIGYRNEPRALRTLVVAEEDDKLRERIEQYATTLGAQLIFEGITSDLESAQESLRQGQIDLITVLPPHAYETIRQNKQAVFLLYHQEIDPFQLDYINVFGRVYINEINRRVLRLVTSTGQQDIARAQEKLETAQISARALRGVLENCAKILSLDENAERCDSETARAYLLQLDHSIDEVDLALGDTLQLDDALQQALGNEAQTRTIDNLADIIQSTNELSQLGETTDDYINSLNTLIELEKDLDVVRTRLDQFLGLDPQVLISPFRSEAQSLAAIVPGVTDFFAPSVVVLLLQHLAVTFAALSMVRESQLGTMELFYVAPLSALETLIGKYFSYLIFGTILAAVLILLIVFGLGVPVLGGWLAVVAVIVTLLFTSMGVGFIISMISKTDIQAVQYSMIVLLSSVFFSGFFLSLETLWEPVRLISWSLPATYGILMLRNIMLRGDPLALTLLGQLFAVGLGLFFIAWFLLSRSMANSW